MKYFVLEIIACVIGLYLILSAKPAPGDHRTDTGRGLVGMLFCLGGALPLIPALFQYAN